MSKSDPALKRISESVFTYRALTPQTSTLRLVHILPPDNASQGDTGLDGLPQPRVSCTCTHTTLSPGLRYCALSYTWGDTARTSTIFLNGSIHKVTKNLEEALLYLEPADEPFPIWIDSLCIDQDNDVEKSEQVQQLRHVYSQASKVICWVGAPVEGSDAAMDWIRTFGQRADDLAIGSTPKMYLRNLFRLVHSNCLDEISPAVQNFISDLRESVLSVGNSSVRTARSLSQFVARPYWSRVWIVQEVASGKNIEFRCGHISVSETQLHRATLLMRNLNRVDDLQILGRNDGELSRILSAVDCRKIINNFKIRKAGRPLELMYLVRATETFQASDRRDFVFALLGCAADRAELGLIADYTLTSYQVFLKTTVALLNHGYFDALPRHAYRERSTDLPSWCRDYPEPVLTHGLQQRALDRKAGLGLTSLQPEFKASGDSTLNLHNIRLENLQVLHLYGIPIGRVATRAPIWDATCIGTWFESLAELLQQCDACDSTTPTEDICRTAVADQEIRHGPTKPRLSRQLIDSAMDLLLQTKDWTSLNAESFKRRGLNEYRLQVEIVAPSRRPFRTSTHIGIGPVQLREGDLVYCVPGSQVPIAFRASGTRLTLVGEVYLHGAMDGELADLSKPVTLEVI